MLALLLAWLPLDRALLLAAGAAAGVLLLRWPWLIWLPIAVLLPLSSGLRFGVASVTDFLLAAAVTLWFLDGARRQSLRLRFSPVAAAVAGYVFVLFLSAFPAIDFGQAAAEVVKWLELLVLLLVLPGTVQAAQTRWIAAALVLGGAWQGALGLYQFVFRIGPDFFIIMGRFMRASGTFRQPNPYGGYLGLTLPIALSLALWAWSAFWRRDGSRWASALWGSYFAAATLLMAAGLVASWSRGAWMGAGVGVLIVLVLRSRTAALLTGLAVLMLLAGALLGALRPDAIPQPIAARVQDIPAYFGLTDVLSQPVNDDNFSVIERVAHWVAAQRMWEQAPWLGVGAGNYAAVYPQVHLPRWDDPLGHAHNVYLNVLAETGLLGLAAYLAILVATTVWIWRSFRRAARLGTAEGRWYAALAVGVLGVIGHLAMHNVVDNLFVQGMVLHLGIGLALLHVEFNGVTK